MTLINIISHNLLMLLAIRNITTLELSKKTNIKEQIILNLINCKYKNISSSLIIKFADALNVSIDAFIVGYKDNWNLSYFW